MRLEISLREELREMAHIREENYKRKIASYYNRTIKRRGFVPGDLVLRRTDGGKLDPNCEGPYVVMKEVAPGAYRIKDQAGNPLASTWNVMRLRKYYP